MSSIKVPKRMESEQDVERYLKYLMKYGVRVVNRMESDLNQHLVKQAKAKPGKARVTTSIYKASIGIQGEVAKQIEKLMLEGEVGNDINKEVKKAWQVYKKLLKERLKKASEELYNEVFELKNIENRYQEFRAFYFLNALDQFNPVESVAGYLVGDIETKGGGQVQLKKTSGANMSTFYCPFNVEKELDKLETEGIPIDAFRRLTIPALRNLIKLNLKAELQNIEAQAQAVYAAGGNSNRAQKYKVFLMKQHIKVTAADWYLIELANAKPRMHSTGLQLAVPVHKRYGGAGTILDLVKTEPTFFSVVNGGNHTDPNLKNRAHLKLRTKKNSKKLFRLALGGYGKSNYNYSIHYEDEDAFYAERQRAYKSQDLINDYNAFVQGSYYPYFMDIHNSFFGGLSASLHESLFGAKLY